MSGQEPSATLARMDLAIRSERRRLFGADVAPVDSWDIILVLYLADAEGARLTVRDTIERAGGPLEAGRRRMAYLIQEGVVTGTGGGGIDEAVTLAPGTVTQVEDLIDRVWAMIRAV